MDEKCKTGKGAHSPEIERKRAGFMDVPGKAPGQYAAYSAHFGG